MTMVAVRQACQAATEWERLMRVLTMEIDLVFDFMLMMVHRVSPNCSREVKTERTIDLIRSNYE